MGAIDRCRRLTRDERALVVRAAFCLAANAIGLRIFGLKRMLRLPPVARADAADAEPLVTAVERAGRYVPGGTCLAQSLALARMLRSRGIPAQVRVGVRTSAGFDAHAWVEVGGRQLTVHGPRF